jgi:hypothetical protein
MLSKWHALGIICGVICIGVGTLWFADGKPAVLSVVLGLSLIAVSVWSARKAAEKKSAKSTSMMNESIAQGQTTATSVDSREERS